MNAYFAGRCDVYTTDVSGLIAARVSRAANPADHVIFPEVISKEPFGPAVRHGDDHWFDIVKWSLFAMIEAEELGLTSKNIDQQAKNANPVMQRFVGAKGEFGKDARRRQPLGLQHHQTGGQLRREFRAPSDAFGRRSRHQQTLESRRAHVRAADCAERSDCAPCEFNAP